MSTVDEQTSTKIGEAVTAKGATFLEGPVSGSKKPAIDGQLIIMGAGDKGLYELVQVGGWVRGAYRGGRPPCALEYRYTM